MNTFDSDLKNNNTLSNSLSNKIDQTSQIIIWTHYSLTNQLIDIIWSHILKKYQCLDKQVFYYVYILIFKILIIIKCLNEYRNNSLKRLLNVNSSFAPVIIILLN